MADPKALLSLLPSLLPMLQGNGPAMQAFMDGWQQADVVLQRQGLAEREMAQREDDNAFLRERLAQQGAAQERATSRANAVALLNALPGAAEAAVAAPVGITEAQGPLAEGPVSPQGRRWAQRGRVADVLGGLADALGADERAVAAVAPQVPAALSRAERARLTRRRTAIEAALAKAEKQLTPAQLRDSNPNISFVVDDVEEQLPYDRAGAEVGWIAAQEKPAAPPRAGSFEDFTTATPERRAQILQDREAYMQADDRRPATSAAAPTKTPGRPMLSSDSAKLGELATSLDDALVLQDVVGQGDTGYLARLGAAAPNWVTELTGWGEEAKTQQAVINRVKQVIGKALEGGVLRREDEYKYKEILPTIGDAPSVAKAKVRGLVAAIRQRRERELERLEDANFDTSRFRARDTGRAAIRVVKIEEVK